MLIDLNRSHMRCSLHKFCGEDADAGSDFDDVIFRVNVACFHDAPEDFFINQEMLTQVRIQLYTVC